MMTEPLGIRAHVAARAVDLNLTAPAGLTTAVVGPNGAGKSTLIQLVSGQLRVDAGQVTLGEQTLSRPGLHVPTHHRRVAVLSQRPLLFPHLSALDNVAFGPRARGVPHARARDRAAAELDAVGCAELAGRRPHQLSGGQAQRIALARALAIDPRALLLDEPLAALDAGAAPTIRRLLAERLLGRTCLVVTHDPLDLWTLASNVVVLERGRVVASGPPEAVLGRPTTDFVARLAGLTVLRGEASGPDRLVSPGGLVVTGMASEDWSERGPALATIAPESVGLHPHAPGGSPRNAWTATVSRVEPRGPVVRAHLVLEDGQALTSDVTARAAASLDLAEGATLVASVKATQVTLQPA